jgi:chitin disaccharide deacetylase
VSELTWRLGLGDKASVAIITADDLGLCHAANAGVFDALSSGLATSASLLVAAPWARQAAATYRGEDVGVLLAVTAEHELLRFGPLTHAPSLLGGDGGFAGTVADALDHADLDEVRRECRAQLERAILFGLDVTHLASASNALITRPEFFDVILELAEEYRLPLRLLSGHSEAAIGFPARTLAKNAGIIVPDRVIDTTSTGLRARLDEIGKALGDGVTEIVIRPAFDADELSAFANDALVRVDDHRLATREATFKALLRDHGVTTIGWKPLLELARRSPSSML